MTQMVRVAVAGDVAEAEEIQDILRSAGIESELADGEDDSVTVSVPESEIEEAQNAIEAMTEPDDLIESVAAVSDRRHDFEPPAKEQLADEAGDGRMLISHEASLGRSGPGDHVFLPLEHKTKPVAPLHWPVGCANPDPVASGGRSSDSPRQRVFLAIRRPAGAAARAAGEQARAVLNEQERKGWWLRLPEFPQAPPDEWTHA